MPIFSDVAAFRLIVAVSVVFAQAYQLARVRMAQRAHVYWEIELLRRELEILRGQRENLDPQRRPEYSPDQRRAIVQIMQLRNWNTTLVDPLQEI